MRTARRRRCGRLWTSTLDEDKTMISPPGRHTPAAARPGIVQTTVNELHTSPARRHGGYSGIERITGEAEVTTRHREALDQGHVESLKASHDASTASSSVDALAE